MTSFRRNCILFIFFLVFVFILFSPETSLAVNYTTECGETFSIGSCWSVCCEWVCCGWDEFAGCTASCCVRECTQCSCSGNWKEYKTDTAGCEPKILVRECRSVCGPAAACCSCGPCQAQCDPWEVCEECGSWQKAERSCEVTKEGLTMPECNKCDKNCLDKPSNPQYYDNPTYPNDICAPESGKSQNNIYLPVKLDWDDVRGWGKEKGWREDATCPKTCSASCPSGCIYPDECYEIPECVHSYAIKIEGEMRDCKALKKIEELEEKIEKETDLQEKAEYRKEIERIKKEELEINTYEKVSDKSEFIPPCSCMFKSNRTYKWQVKACCDADGKTNCAPKEKESNWSFTTNAAPEPYYPFDPDWSGKEVATNTNFEGLTLEWCTTTFKADKPNSEPQQPLSFLLNFYVVENDKEKCHPEFWVGGKCDSQILRPQPEAGLLYPPPEFPNDKYGYFTKDTSYVWEVAACKDISYQECTDFSQRWRFSTKEFTLLESGPALPPNDPTGEKPVGLPVVLQWGPPPGAKSYIYEVSTLGQMGTKSTSASFDYPKLSLDTLYSWKIKACWDYDQKNCESNWSKTFYFKTTGRPPVLTHPKGDNISIPVNFKWGEVSGAKSYVFRIQSTGLNLEKITEKPEFFLDYPDLKQETNYSWQVKTCAREKGEVCGGYSNPQSFRTFKLPPPSNPSPSDNGEFFTYQKNYVLSWQSVGGAKFYQYEVNFVNVSVEEKDASCKAGKLIPQLITKLNISTPLPLICLGDYQWKVRACLDKDCEELGNWSSDLKFSLVEKEAPQEKGGIVPCGRTSDDPTTPFWNEREPCQIKHIFLLIRNIIDFVLWTIAPIFLALLVLATGLIFYLSLKFQTPSILARIKTLWKAAGIGYGIIFLSWTILNLFLNLIGFKVGIFGNWWQVGF